VGSIGFSVGLGRHAAELTLERFAADGPSAGTAKIRPKPAIGSLGGRVRLAEEPGYSSTGSSFVAVLDGRASPSPSPKTSVGRSWGLGASPGRRKAVCSKGFWRVASRGLIACVRVGVKPGRLRAGCLFELQLGGFGCDLARLLNEAS
jgi:hypothetical protein